MKEAVNALWQIQFIASGYHLPHKPDPNLDLERIACIARWALSGNPKHLKDQSDLKNLVGEAELPRS